MLISLSVNERPDNIAGMIAGDLFLVYSWHLQSTKKKTSSSPGHSIPFARNEVDWKLAKVLPVHKKDEKDNVENCRPTSLLCIVSKVLECCVLNRIKERLQELIVNCQRVSLVFLFGIKGKANKINIYSEEKGVVNQTII